MFLNLFVSEACFIGLMRASPVSPCSESRYGRDSLQAARALHSQSAEIPLCIPRLNTYGCCFFLFLFFILSSLFVCVIYFLFWTRKLMGRGTWDKLSREAKFGGGG